eukprot:CAMPEP_0182513716 /NCGR_PEP_ID=MMETSP1321-20130603/34476_1 /TAXON_ID=91990 /ORGANISM="Bolidomonas sp., Strain RCC1657" /LENGTH=84 /DNA_ID=CAMNT_0024720779 /DNA_START=52 /DNA_END=306 /DNA_ORIENTATION=-
MSRRVGMTRWSVILEREREQLARLQNEVAQRRWVAIGASLDILMSSRTTPSSTRRAWLFFRAVKLQIAPTNIRSILTFIENPDR